MNTLIGKGNIITKTSDKDEKEFDILKKYNRKMRLLKIIAVLLALFLIFAWGFKGIQSIYRYYNGKYAYEIISKVYESTQNLKTKNNFYLSRRDSFSKSDFYYKDEKFKYVSQSYENTQSPYSSYGKISGDTTIWFHIYNENGKSINGYVEHTESCYQLLLFSDVLTLLYELSEKSILELGKINVSEENFEYILKYFSNDQGFMLVINKETMLVSQYINLSNNVTDNCIHYEYMPERTKDKDLKLEVENLDEYTMDEELKPYIYNF